MAKYNVSKSEAKKLGIKRVLVSGKSSSGKNSGSSDYKDIIKKILKSTPAQQKVLPDFETTYSGALESEDYAQSEALYKPYFEQKIANELEDLNAWSEAESISYDRSLRRARFSLAVAGGAQGEGATGERAVTEGEMATDESAKVAGVVRGSERAIGTQNITNAGYKSAGQNQEGDIVGKMKESIQSGQLWFKNQRAQRYYGNANTYYSQPSPYSLAGTSM